VKIAARRVLRFEGDLRRERNSRSDEQLWMAWMRFERLAFEELFKRYHPRACALASSMQLSDEDAQDIAQETMLDLSRARRLSVGRHGLDDDVCAMAAINSQRRRRDNLRRGRAADVALLEERNRPIDLEPREHRPSDSRPTGPDTGA
jgi:DNA-directed RNA polymerase specialized sigma24 family protein